MNVVILGATRGMGRSLARLLAESGERLMLLGRGREALDQAAADLKARSPTGAGAVAGVAHCDLEDPATFGPALDAAQVALGGIDAVIVTAGLYAAQEDLEADPVLCARLLTVNFTNTIRFCEDARSRLLAAGRGTLCVFSSVAGERGRKPVAIYGASKAGLSHYLESLDFRFRARGLRTVCVKPGFVRTDMTAGMPEPPFAGDPDRVARDVARAIRAGTPEIYTPRIWRLVMAVIRTLPRFVMRRVKF